MSLIHLWRARQITERQKEAGDDAENKNPDFFENKMPDVAVIESPPSLTDGLKWRRRSNARLCDSLGCSFCCRDHVLENAFGDRNSIAGFHSKVAVRATTAARQFF